MYLDWESNTQPFGVRDNAPTNWATLARARHLFLTLVNTGSLRSGSQHLIYLVPSVGEGSRMVQRLASGCSGCSGRTGVHRGPLESLWDPKAPSCAWGWAFGRGTPAAQPSPPWGPASLQGLDRCCPTSWWVSILIQEVLLQEAAERGVHV